MLNETTPTNKRQESQKTSSRNRKEGEMTYAHCPTHNGIKIDDQWDYVDDLLETLKSLNKPSFQACCDKCSDLERRTETFNERWKSGYYDSQREKTQEVREEGEETSKQSQTELT